MNHMNGLGLASRYMPQMGGASIAQLCLKITPTVLWLLQLSFCASLQLSQTLPFFHPRMMWKHAVFQYQYGVGLHLLSFLPSWLLLTSSPTPLSGVPALPVKHLPTAHPLWQLLPALWPSAFLNWKCWFLFWLGVCKHTCAKYVTTEWCKLPSLSSVMTSQNLASGAAVLVPSWFCVTAHRYWGCAAPGAAKWRGGREQWLPVRMQGCQVPVAGRSVYFKAVVEVPLQLKTRWHLRCRKQLEKHCSWHWRSSSVQVSGQQRVWLVTPCSSLWLHVPSFSSFSSHPPILLLQSQDLVSIPNCCREGQKGKSPLPMLRVLAAAGSISTTLHPNCSASILWHFALVSDK